MPRDYVQGDDVLRVVVNGVYPVGWKTQNVFYWKVSSGSLTKTFEETLDILETKVLAMWDEFADPISETYELVSIQAEVVTYNSGSGNWEIALELGERAITWAGNATGDALPPYVSAVIGATTGEAKTRGRKSLAGVHEGAQVAGVLTEIALGLLAAFAAEWLVPAVFSGAQVLIPVIANKLGVPAPLLEVVASTILGTQNSRKYGAGV